MKAPAIPADEKLRIASLRALRVLDTSAEERFDRLTRLAQRLFDVPMALVSLVDEDRQWFKSRQGLDAEQTPRDISFCGHAILGKEVFVVPDASADPRFADNPLVVGGPHIRFYAGRPLLAPNGYEVGTLCLIDNEPRNFSEADAALLQDLAQMAEQELGAVQLATMDELTAVSNRRGFEALTRHTLSICSRIGAPASMVFIDLDGFKDVNDRFGHGEGDRALSDFAKVLVGSLRESDVVGRLGGDEFAALLVDSTSTTLCTVLERLEESIARHNRDAGRGYDLCYSVGAVEFDPERHGELAVLMADADRQMYAQKRIHTANPARVGNATN